MGRDPCRLGRLGGDKGLPLEFLGLTQISARERIRAESGESERRVVAEPDAPASSSARRYASTAAAPSCCRSATHASSSSPGTRNAS